jgi:hypothetical protein
MNISKLLILLSVLSNTAFAQFSPKAIEDSKIDLVNCPKDSLEVSMGYCTYTLRNLDRAQSLIRVIEQTLFKGDHLVAPEGILERLGNNNKVMTFWHKDPEVLRRMKEIIPMLDTKENFYPNTIVEMKLDIYEVAETSLTSLAAEITNLQIGAGISDLTNTYGVSSAGNNGVNVDLKLGLVQLSGLLSAEKQKGKLNKVITIKKAVPNLTSIKYSDATMVYNAPGAGVTIKENKGGVTMSGIASVEASETGLVNIKGFDFKYGIPNEDATVRIISSPYDTLTMQEGVALPIVISNSNSKLISSEVGFLGFGRKVVKENARLVVYASVEVKSWDEYISEIKSILQVGKQYFDGIEHAKLATNICPTDLELLNDIILVARRDISGDPLLTVRLDKDNACLKNIKQRIKIRISGEGLPRALNVKHKTAEFLMHIPMRIKQLGLTKYIEKPLLNFKIKLETTSNGVKTKVSKKLFFEPGDYDLRDSFWIE